jgi:hypothetical protein
MAGLQAAALVTPVRLLAQVHTESKDGVIVCEGPFPALRAMFGDEVEPHPLAKQWGWYAYPPAQRRGRARRR